MKGAPIDSEERPTMLTSAYRKGNFDLVLIRIPKLPVYETTPCELKRSPLWKRVVGYLNNYPSEMNGWIFNVVVFINWLSKTEDEDQEVIWKNVLTINVDEHR